METTRLKMNFLSAIIALQVLLTTRCLCEVSYQRLDENWTLMNANKSIRANCTTPGGIYSDLMNANVIGDVLYRFNDVEYRWVAKENWTYVLHFKVEPSMVQGDYLQLIFEGVDTYADVYLNDKLILQTDNMFVQYAVNCKDVIQEDLNNLTILFHSPIWKAQELYDDYVKKYKLPALPKCVPNEFHGECHVNYLRKMQASFGWDWAPAVPSVGLWKAVYLMSYDVTKIENVLLSTLYRPIDETWIVNLTLYFSNRLTMRNQRFIMTLNLKEDEIRSYNFENVKLDTNFSTFLEVPNKLVKRWWPNGFGEQNLYDLFINMYDVETSEPVASKKLQIGFRTIELVQDSISEKAGNEFYFKVNNVSMFMKGSNWAPIDILPERGYDSQRLHHLLYSAKVANMNMLRVWGGGVYESDEFYELADQFGILIWQDFMFACSMYPVNKEFLGSVRTEVTQQVLRLNHHPCIAIWSANNENEAAFVKNWFNTSEHFEEFERDYLTLYVDNVRQIVKTLDPFRAFAMSSPSDGVQTDKENFIACNPGDGHYGDIHYYNYKDNSWSQEYLPLGRFVSEFGYQSLPSIDTLRTQTNVSKDLTLNSTFYFKRQHHLNGYKETHFLIRQNLQNATNLRSFSFLSQVNQAISIQKKVEYYRIYQNQLTPLLLGHTMGALYWQLNDVWAAPSWSSIDYRGNWKMLHYYAKRFFAPITVATLFERNDYLHFYAVSDLDVPFSEVSLFIEAIQWERSSPIYTHQVSFNMDALSSQFVDNINIPYFLRDKAHCDNSLTISKYRCFLSFYLVHEEKQITPRNYLFPVSIFYAIGLERPSLRVKVEEISETKYEITVSESKVVLFVWLESRVIDGYFSDNAIVLDNSFKTIQFVSTEPTNLKDFRDSLKVTNLFDYV